MVKRYSKPLDSDKPRNNLTSMIDIVFLLLIFFLVSTNFPDPEAILKCWNRKSGIKNGDPFQLEETKLILARQNGHYTLSCPDLASPNGFRSFPMQTVQDWQTRQMEKVPHWQRVKGWLAARHKAWLETGDSLAFPLILEFKPDVPMRHVAKLMDTCKAAGIHKYKLALPEELF